MRVAVVGSRDLLIPNLADYIPPETTAIISGGARGVDTCAREYALLRKIALVEILPQYEKFGRRAPLLRNLEIIERADLVLAFWDGRSHGTRFVIEECERRHIPLRVIPL